MRIAPNFRYSCLNIILMAFVPAELRLAQASLITSSPTMTCRRASSPPLVFYTVGSNGLLTLKAKILTGRGGIAGGYFAANRVNVLDSGNAECVYASVAQSGEIEGIGIKTLKLEGHAVGSANDTGAANGVGLAMNSQYLYASFTDHSTIGTFKVLPGCKIKFVNDISVSGLQAGTIDGMVIHGNIMVVTYGDGSIESFNISGGVPVSNGDEQNSTGSRRGNTYPSGVDITKDGHFAIFGDTSPFTVVEVSDISSGKLTPTVVYGLGKEINSSNVLLSPDESLLYITNNQSGTVSAAFFDKSTGKAFERLCNPAAERLRQGLVVCRVFGVGRNYGHGRSSICR